MKSGLRLQICHEVDGATTAARAPSTASTPPTRPRRRSSASASAPRRQGPRRPHLAEAAASGAQAPTGRSAGRPRPDPRLLRQEQDAAGAPPSRPLRHQQIPRGVPPPIVARGAGSPDPRRPLPGRRGLRPAAPPGATRRGDRGGGAGGGGLGFRPPGRQEEATRGSEPVFSSMSQLLDL
jgi:hypothetical protein